MTTIAATPATGWSHGQRLKLSGIVAVIALLHVAGWSLYLFLTAGPLGAGAFAGAGVLAYVLGVRHAFDADHIAAIDDTTRLMVQRGRRPVGVGFFFAMGHSSVVVALSLVIALAAGAATTAQVDAFREIGGTISTVVAMVFLALVAVLNAMVLRGIVKLWTDLRAGRLDEPELERQLLNRGLVNRILGGRARAWIRHSWHMYPLGFLFGLGLETASEVTLLTLSATTASSAGVSGGASLLAALTLPLLFAAGMSAFDTADGLLMSVAYSWSNRNPARRLFYNIATTAATVSVAGFIASVYLAGVLADDLGVVALAGYAGLADDFELLGYVIVGFFVLVWGGAALLWRFGGFEERHRAGA
ncbi:HoxN/HupN/NixA family nickel/cobalt transporter [Actinomycetospora sp. NBRC 106378]|uniref:HoxN/HupN/NixA family nickel/cobalt transporter n=1 Tax=Actinomycetospora sp. NBRC 106378 TaxID=3032208 RepID=UPI0024A58839|nr:HoxN/HupN/NixA family nickel/cobalt transporter [Actinomycetospora sp. NBRC 106378]GLZ51090.1 nickel/cobalt efflux system [Actinomycetospora sp. NBRC 106378]